MSAYEKRESSANQVGVVQELASLRNAIVSFQPQSRREAMIQLSCLVAVSLATGAPMSDTELAKLSASIGQFKTELEGSK